MSSRVAFAGVARNFFVVAAAVEPRARGVEQAHERLCAARVFEQQEQIEGALVDAQQRGGQMLLSRAVPAVRIGGGARTPDGVRMI